MKLVTWNVRGLSVMSRRRILRQDINVLGANVIAIQETKLGVGLVKGLNSLSRHHDVRWVEAIGSKGGLALLIVRNWLIDVGVEMRRDPLSVLK
eukprot:c40534_g1_i1 orf=41-322(+)